MVRAKRLRLVDDVRRSLEEAILCGEMRPGDRLPVAQVAQEFNVSLTTVREALLMLENQGLVVNKPRYGAFVARLSGQEAYELCQARALLESFAVTVGLEQIDDAFVERLEALLEEMGNCVLPQDLPSVIRIDLAIHKAIIELSDSQRIVELWSSLSGQIGALIMRSVEQQSSEIDDIVQLHRELIVALATADTKMARHTVVYHYLRDRSEYGDFADVVVETTDANLAVYAELAQSAALR
jgi:DNA-binding GntR family transcriptional regulator